MACNLIRVLAVLHPPGVCAKASSTGHESRDARCTIIEEGLCMTPVLSCARSRIRRITAPYSSSWPYPAHRLLSCAASPLPAFRTTSSQLSTGVHAVTRFPGTLCRSHPTAITWISMVPARVLGRLTAWCRLVELVGEEDVCFFSEDVTEPIRPSARTLLRCDAGLRWEMPPRSTHMSVACPSE
jgi:hypothetical protein